MEDNILKAVPDLLSGTDGYLGDLGRCLELLCEDETRVNNLLAQTELKEDVTADLVHLIEFERNTLKNDCQRHSATGLLHHVVRFALDHGKNDVAVHLINRLYIRGFGKQLVNALITNLVQTVSNKEMLSYSPWRGSILSGSNSTAMICAHALRALARMVDYLHRNDQVYMRFACMRDYNVATCIITLFLNSMVVTDEQGAHEKLMLLFHPRSSAHLPLKMQLMLIHLLGNYIGALGNDPLTNSEHDGGTVEHQKQARRLSWDEPDGSDPDPVVPAIEGDKTFTSTGTKISERAKNVIATLEKAAGKVLRKLSALWAEREVQRHSANVDYVDIASVVVKLMDTLYPEKTILIDDEFESVSILLNSGINARLGAFSKELQAAALHVAAALSKWDAKRQELLGHPVDNVVDFSDSKIGEEVDMTRLLASGAPFIVEDRVPDNVEAPCTDPTGEATTYPPNIANEATDADGNHAAAPISEAKCMQPSTYADDVANLVDDIFRNVKPLEDMGNTHSTPNGWTDPPNHIQQCFERLCDAAVAGDVEPAKLMNGALNRPRQMPHSVKREVVAQTLLYLPIIIERNETVLSRFAVPLSQVLLKMQEPEQYDEPLAEIRKRLKVGAPIVELGSALSPLDVFSGEHAAAELDTAQHLVYASLLCITVRRPDDVFEFFCKKVADSEYSAVQHVTMMLCMQCAAKRLCKQKSYKELSQNILTNVQCLRPLTALDGSKVTRLRNGCSKSPLKLSQIKLPRGSLSTANSIRIRPTEELLIVPVEQRVGDKRQNLPGPSRVAIAQSAHTTKLIEEIRPVAQNRGSIVSTVEPAAISVLKVESTVDVVNKFAPLANMAVSHILETIKTLLKKDSGRMETSLGDLLLLGSLETLHVFLTCSDGRLSPYIRSECMDMVMFTQEKVYKNETLDMLERIVTVLDSLAPN